MSSAAEKPLKICVRGLPANTELRSIQKDLRDRGFDPIFLRHVDAKGKGTGVFCVQLQITPDILKVLDIKKMVGVPVKVEAWRGRQGPPQCQRCQGFRHSAAECLREYRCVHCARPHPLKQCNRPYDIPTCANCRGPHAANDLSCPAMRREEIAKSGLMLRTSGYELATPKSVDESNAPSSLMAAANGKWTESKRRCRKKKAEEKSERTPTHEQQSQETQLPTVISGYDKKNPIIKEVKIPLISQQVQFVFVKEKNAGLPQETLPEKTLNDSFTENTSQAISLNQNMSSPVTQNQPASQKLQPTHIEPVKRKTQELPVQSPIEPVTYTSPDAVRAKFVYECVHILQNVLSAIQHGQNPVPIILESLAQLYKDT